MSRRREMAVNSEPCVRVNRAVSAQGLAVLRALAATAAREYGRYYDGTPAITPAGQLAVAELVDIVARPGASLGVTRASLSRTLRRLWAAGFVELYNRQWTSKESSLSAVQQRALEEFAPIEADPETAYREHLEFMAATNWHSSFGSAAAYLEHRRRRANRPDYYVRHVEITAAGRLRLTDARAHQLTAAEAA